jgi:hypothetical protein
MPTRTPADKRGCRTLAVLAVALGFGVVAASFVLRGRWPAPPPEAAGRSSVPDEDSAGRQLIEEQRKLIAEQSQAVREELRKLHDERIALRKVRIETLADGFTDGDRREYDQILLENTCGHVIAVALHYRDLDEAWVTRGWWMVQPGETVETDAYSRNAYLYFFAENGAVGRKWDGEGEEGALALDIVDEKFDHLEDDRFVYAAPRRVPFYRRKTGDAWGPHREKFECLLEARPQPPRQVEAPPAPPP